MRRTAMIVVATAALTSILTSAAVAAVTGGDRRATSSAERSSRPLEDRLPVIVDTNVDCGTPPGGRPWESRAALERTVRCLEREVENVNRFMKAFFRCARIVPVSQYGEDPQGGSFGYVWNDGVEQLLTTALDYTVDPAVEPFSYFVLWRASTFCTT